MPRVPTQALHTPVFVGGHSGWKGKEQTCKFVYLHGFVQFVGKEERLVLDTLNCRKRRCRKPGQRWRAQPAGPALSFHLLSPQPGPTGHCQPRPHPQGLTPSLLLPEAPPPVPPRPGSHSGCSSLPAKVSAAKGEWRTQRE